MFQKCLTEKRAHFRLEDRKLDTDDRATLLVQNSPGKTLQKYRIHEF